jgi:hypothetical protein
MNSKAKLTEDPLKEYISPEKTENAPEGFTAKVMTRIQLETEPIIAKKYRTRSLVPAISAFITLLLIIIAFILPEGNSETGVLPGMKLIQDLDLSVLKSNIDSLLSFSIPEWLPYIFISILILTIFDRALFGLFHRNDSQKSL